MSKKEKYAVLNREQWEQANTKWNEEKGGIRARTKRKEKFDNWYGWTDFRVKDKCGYCKASIHKTNCFDCILWANGVCNHTGKVKHVSAFWLFIKEMRKDRPNWRKAQRHARKIGKFIAKDAGRVEG